MVQERPDLTHRGLMVRIAVINAVISTILLMITVGGFIAYQAGWQASLEARVLVLEEKAKVVADVPSRLTRIETIVERIDRKLGP